MSPEAGSAGLATRAARVSLILVWVTGVVQALLGGGGFPVLGGGFPVPGGAIGVLTGVLPLVGIMLVTTRRPGPLPPTRAGLTLVCVLLVALSVLAFFDLADRSAAELWLFSINSYLAAGLIIRGNPLSGAVGATGVVMLGLAWGVATRQNPAGLVEMLAPAVSAAVIATLWRVVLRAVTGQERAVRAEARRAEGEAYAAEVAAQRSRHEVAEIVRLAGPPLTDLAAGRTIDEQFLRELTVAEGGIRDRIRAADLVHPDLAAAIAEARARGARVLLLGAEQPGEDPLSDRLAAALADVVTAAQDATIQVRPGGVVSVLARAADGSAVRLLFDADGQRVNGQIIGT